MEHKPNCNAVLFKDYGCDCGADVQQEMTSLREIRAALGRIEQALSAESPTKWAKELCEAIKRIEENQGKLLAALKVVETVCDALREELGEAREAGRNSNTALSGQMSGGFDGLVDVISLLPSKVFREFQARVTPEYAKPMAAKAKRPAKRRSRK